MEILANISLYQANVLVRYCYQDMPLRLGHILRNSLYHSISNIKDTFGSNFAFQIVKKEDDILAYGIDQLLYVPQETCDKNTLSRLLSKEALKYVVSGLAKNRSFNSLINLNESYIYQPMVDLEIQCFDESYFLKSFYIENIFDCFEKLPLTILNNTLNYLEESETFADFFEKHYVYQELKKIKEQLKYNRNADSEIILNKEEQSQQTTFESEIKLEENKDSNLFRKTQIKEQPLITIEESKESLNKETVEILDSKICTEVLNIPNLFSYDMRAGRLYQKFISQLENIKGKPTIEIIDGETKVSKLYKRDQTK